MSLNGIQHENPDQEEPPMAESQITSFTPSEIFHGLTLGYVDDPDNYTADEYLAALNIAKSAHREQFEAANPSAAQVERRQMERRLEIKRAEEQQRPSIETEPPSTWSMNKEKERANEDA
jgi:hypothetical protein